jgi:hypothetical protein
MKMNKKVLKISGLLLAFLLFFVVLPGIYLSIRYYQPEEVFVTEFDFFVTAEKNGGFNLDRDKMHFGKVCVGCVAKRGIDLFNKNNYTEKYLIKIASANETTLGFFSIYPDSSHILRPGEKKTFELYVSIPPGEEPGKHEGEVIIERYRALPWEK